MNFLNLVLLQIIRLELSNMNNNCAVEINSNHSAQGFEDYAVVETMVQVDMLIMFHLLNVFAVRNPKSCSRHSAAFVPGRTQMSSWSAGIKGSTATPSS